MMQLELMLVEYGENDLHIRKLEQELKGTPVTTVSPPAIWWRRGSRLSWCLGLRT